MAGWWRKGSGDQPLAKPLGKQQIFQRCKKNTCVPKNPKKIPKKSQTFFENPKNPKV